LNRNEIGEMYLSALITQRSEVQILSPQPPEALEPQRFWGFCHVPKQR